MSISHDMETLRALNESREAPAGCYEVTNSFGFTQEERRAGGEVGAARLRHPGQDPFQACKGNRDSQGQIRLCAGPTVTEVPVNRTCIWRL